MVTEAGSYLRLIDFCITQLKAQGPSRTCNESKEEEKVVRVLRGGGGRVRVEGFEFRVSCLGVRVEALGFRDLCLGFEV